MVRTASFIVALTIALLPALACVADPVPSLSSIANAGPAPIVQLTISPSQVSTSPSQSVGPSNVNQLRQPVYPGTQQSIAIPAPQQTSYEVRAVYADGHTVTIPFWNVSDTPILLIRYGPP